MGQIQQQMSSLPALLPVLTHRGLRAAQARDMRVVRGFDSRWCRSEGPQTQTSGWLGDQTRQLEWGQEVGPDATWKCFLGLCDSVSLHECHPHSKPPRRRNPPRALIPLKGERSLGRMPSAPGPPRHCCRGTDNLKNIPPARFTFP